jgi:hypothetical protein
MAPPRKADGAMDSYAALGRVNENYAGFCVRNISLPLFLLPPVK